MSDFLTVPGDYQKYEPKMNRDNTVNTNYVDLLDEDKAIANQTYVCVSFVSPEKILAQKDIFYFNEFLNKWDFSKSMEKFIQFLNFMSVKHRLSFDDTMTDFKEFVADEKDELTINTLADDYKSFVDIHDTELNEMFQRKNNFQTCIRGVKIRGSYPTMEEAEIRCKMIRQSDPNHDVFVGPVGMWMPWDPESYKTDRVEYMDDELNQLMHEKNQNESSAKNAFDNRVKTTKQDAIQNNIKKSIETGNVLTQAIDTSGNLVGVNNINTQETKLTLDGENDILTSDIRKELFEGDNIVVSNTDHGKKTLTNDPFSSK